nr:MAG TPA: hypothetical protein [Caudoviricetes sp.]
MLLFRVYTLLFLFLLVGRSDLLTISIILQSDRLVNGLTDKKVYKSTDFILCK